MKDQDSSSKFQQRLTTSELAEYFQVSPRTIQNWRDCGKIPFLRISARCFRYDLEDIEKELSK